MSLPHRPSPSGSPSGFPSGSPSGKTSEIDPSIASSPCNIGAVPVLLSDISFLRSHSDVSSNRDARLYLLDKARALVQALETPRETMLKHVGAETACFFSLALGVDVGLFDALAGKGGNPKKVAELAGTIGFDVDALSRILRHLAAMGYIVQTGSDEYQANNFSKAMTIPIVADGYPFYRSVCIPPMLNLHKWLATKNYTTPTTVRDNPFTFGNQTSQTMFEYLAASPPFNEQFNHHMGGYRLGRPSWFDSSVYPVSTTLLDSVTDDQVLLVDIGGNMGHDLSRFRSAFPSSPGRLILQDQASVIAAAPTSSLSDQGIEAMAHDFFTEQPVRGARAYYLHHILHDWPDDKCEAIVSQIKQAMTPGWSKLLINEHVIPGIGASWETTYLDLYMMILFGSRERTEDDWLLLLEKKCGLKITRIYNPGNGVEGIIECEVPVDLSDAEEY